MFVLTNIGNNFITPNVYGVAITQKECALPPHLAVAGDDVFVGGELGEAHRAAGVEFLGADAYFGAEAELGAVGEGGGDIHVDAGGVHL